MIWLFLACSTHEWRDGVEVTVDATMAPGDPERAVSWRTTVDVDVDRLTDEDDDSSLDADTVLEVRQRVRAGFAGSGVVRVLWWGEEEGDRVPPPEEIELSSGGEWEWAPGWRECGPPCETSYDLRFDLREGGPVELELVIEVDARAEDEDNPVLGGTVEIAVDP